MSDDPARRRIVDVARFLRVTGYGRSNHPSSVLLNAANWLLAPLEHDGRKRCRDCPNFLPEYVGRGARRKVCESCRPPRPHQYRANISDSERLSV